MLTDFTKLNTQSLPSPAFVVDEVALERNLKILAEVADKSGAKLLHALKAFSMWSLAPLTNQYLSGTCSSGLHEALLAKEFYTSNDAKNGNSIHTKNQPSNNGEIHVYSAGYHQADMEQLLEFADHVLFNSPTQLLKFADLCKRAKHKRQTTKRPIHFGLRINPEHSEGAVALYDPCAPCSRLGTTRSLLDKYLKQDAFLDAWQLIDGLHFHTLCEQGFEPLQRTLTQFEATFADVIPNMSWLNFGGGHHITAGGYDIEGLIDCIKQTSKKWDVQIYLEPGEAVAIGTGVLVAEVLDVIDNENTNNQMSLAILDTSATCHMPDTLEMPYRADITGAGDTNEKAYTYRLGGLTCLAGDVIGDYSFDEPLQVGQRLIFEDMSHYTMVKTSTFNGTKLPSIVIWNSETGESKVIKNFGYETFKQRLS